MLAIVPVTLIFLGISALLAGVIPAVLTLAESERMTETTTGTIHEVISHRVMEPLVDMDSSRPWEALQVTATVDIPAEGESGGKDAREVSVWVPEWYGPVRVGETISLVYDPASPNTCLIAEVWNVIEEITPIFARLGAALTVIGLFLAIAFAAMGLV